MVCTRSGGVSWTAVLRALTLALAALVGRGTARGTQTILFTTRPPLARDILTVNSLQGNNLAEPCNAPRGGDLYIRYGDGTLRNLTAEAGYGLTPGQDIAVREPTVHWSGTKALFSMVVGGTTPGDSSPVYWQIHEVTGLAPGQLAQITRLPQPATSNNVAPIYGTDDRIIFASDRPHNGNAISGPQLDEYEGLATVTGLWSMQPDGTDLKLLDHSPSGDFTPLIASDGRVVFTRWDHLQRDQLNNEGRGKIGAFNYVSEVSTQRLSTNAEVFPELRTQPTGSFLHGHKFNLFFPWEMTEDGTGLETLNHIGRHELLAFFDSANEALPPFNGPAGRPAASIFVNLHEDPCTPGTFHGVNTREFGTHGAGQFMTLFAPLGFNADDMQLEEITDPITATPIAEGQPVPPGHPGLFRDPLPLSDCTLVGVRTTSPYSDKQTAGPLSSRHDFHMVSLQLSGQYWAPAGRLIPGGIQKSVSYFDRCSGTQVSYSGALWEMDPVEVAPRARPARHSTPLPAIEMAILTQELGGQAGVDQLQAFLQNNSLALVVSRNVTRRADRQQEYNLKIANSTTQTAEPGATPVTIEYLQFHQADLIRGYTTSRVGRRPLAQPMHDGLLPPVSGAPPGAVRLGADGSMAAFVPARRALAWQLVDPNGTPVVRERYWVTFAPGEMRTCANCHGINRTDTVLGQPPPTNPPEALRDLAVWWRSNFSTTQPTATPTPTPTSMSNPSQTPTSSPSTTSSPSQTPTPSPSATANTSATPTAVLLPSPTPTQGLTTATFCVAQGADDGFVIGSGPTYPPPATSANTTLGVISVKRAVGNQQMFQIRVGLARFPTASLPDTANIVGAQLTGRVVTAIDGESRRLVCEFYGASNWPIDTGDYAASPPPPSERACEGSVSVGPFAIDLDPALANQRINRTGDTGIRLHLDDHAPLPPNGLSITDLEAWENAGNNQLCLTVTY